MFADSIIMGHDKYGKGTREGRVYIIGSRQKTGNETGKVVEKNKNSQCSNDEHKFRPAGSHILFNEV